jgi:hypothetical protein
MSPAVKYTMKDTASFPPVKILSQSERLRILVTGGAGFVGSHLVDRLMMAGHQVIVVDNMFTGRQKNVAQWSGHPHFQLIIHDVVESIMLEVDQIYHLACPASPPHYQYNPIKTIKTSTEGTLNMLGLAKRVRVSISSRHPPLSILPSHLACCIKGSHAAHLHLGSLWRPRSTSSEGELLGPCESYRSPRLL